MAVVLYLCRGGSTHYLAVTVRTLPSDGFFIDMPIWCGLLLFDHFILLANIRYNNRQFTSSDVTTFSDYLSVR